ncbi:MAG: RNA methyltransferase [Holophagaceae bacterium]|nr:RNA methyltransferase [Holophagaceae bacterium]
MRLPDRITSRSNPWFKELKGLLLANGTKRTHTLLVGSKVISAWTRSPEQARFHPEAYLVQDGDLQTWSQSDAVIRMKPDLLADLAEAGSPPDSILVCRVGPEPAGPLARRVIVPWEIQDPGNLGAILRAAAAFGFQEALLGPGAADPFSPKALRGSMGAAFLMPVRRVADWPLDLGHWVALDGGPGATPLDRADLSEPLRLLVGNEGHGWAHVELPGAVRRVAIPTQGVESLNAAVAAGIACFEAERRWKTSTSST